MDDGTGRLLNTERLTLRKFTLGDWRDLLEMARLHAQSPFADYDHAWPTNEAEMRGVAEYFSREPQFLAVERKRDAKVIGLVNLGSTDDQGVLDIGHVINLAHTGQGYEQEALHALYDYAFSYLGASGIIAWWTLEDEAKLAPLLNLGMTIVHTEPAKRFRPDVSDSMDSPFHACKLEIIKERWAARACTA